jgi:hypothetical protein
MDGAEGARIAPAAPEAARLKLTRWLKALNEVGIMASVGI